jgi:hypothetical protein
MFGTLLLALLLMVSESRPGELSPYVETSQKEFAFYPGGKLEISAALPGNVQITGWPKAAIRVEMEKRIFAGSPDEAQSLSKLFPVRITHTAASSRIEIAGVPKKQQPPAMEISLVIYVPVQKTDLAVKMIRGNLAIASLNGSIEASLEAGNIVARKLDGYFSGLTKTGELEVELHRKYWQGYGFSAVTRLGSVSVKVPVDYSAVLQQEARNGRITADYPEQEVPLQVLEKKKSQFINGPIGSGGTPVRVATMSGNVELSPIK